MAHAHHEKQTVIVDHDGSRHSSPAWLGVVVAVLLIILLFMLFGGMSMLGGGGGSGSTNIAPSGAGQ